MWATRLSVTAILPVILAACGHGEADGDRRLASLREELARVQADRDRVDQRLMALETRSADVPAPAKPEARPAPVETPPLRVVRITPGGARPDATSTEETAGAMPVDIDDGSARPVLRVTGEGRTKRRAGAEPARDHVEQTWPSEEQTAASGQPALRERAPRPSALDPAARRAYDDAFALVRSNKCQQALDAFAGFLLRYPDHPNADNAMYWRGECYLSLGDVPRALEQLEGTVARFPLGNKVPDALLKLGIAYTKLGNPAKAKDAWDRLEREFPLSEARRRVPRGNERTSVVSDRPESKT